MPVPTKDDHGRWEQRGWEPQRQQSLLEAAAPFVERLEWDHDLRDQFNDRFSAAGAAREIDSVGRHAAGIDSWELTRIMVSERIRGHVLADAPDGDVRAVSVYAQADRFDRDWRVDAVFPFVHRTSAVTPGRLREVREPAPTGLQTLAHLVVTRLVVPNDGRDDIEVLRKTVALLERADVSARRAEFQAVLGQFYADGLKDETIVGEIDDLLTAYNDAVRKHTYATKARAVVQVAAFTESAAALWVPPIALAAGPTVAAGEALIKRNYGEPAQGVIGAVGLLAEAQAALRG